MELNSGDIYEIQMEHNLGYAYAKYTWIDNGYREIQMIQFFDYFTSQPALKPNEIEKVLVKLKNAEFITNRIKIFNHPPYRGKYKSKKIGNLPITEREKKLPDFKGCRSDILRFGIEANIPSWLLEKGDGGLQKGEYEKIKHLQTSAMDDWHSQSIRITMLYLKKQGLNIENYYKLDKVDINLYDNINERRKYLSHLDKLELMYFWINNTPFYYDIPVDIREKAIE
jgi:hypothetical protein